MQEPLDKTLNPNMSNYQKLTHWEQGNINLTELKLDYINDAITLSRIISNLKIDTSLTQFSLTESTLSPTHAKQLADFFKTNSTITVLNLTKNEIGQDIIYFAKPLQTNNTLTELDLSDNPITDIELLSFQDALKHNYTLLKLKFSNLPENHPITSYLTRNAKIDECFASLKNAKILHHRIDGEHIELCLNQLHELLKDLDSLPDDSYPSEGHRLLNALGHLTMDTIEAKNNALECLLPPFKYAAFQNIAHEALAYLFTGELNNNSEDGDLKKNLMLLILFNLRDHLDTPEIRIFADIALFKLVHPNKPYTYQEKQKFEKTTILLSESQILKLIQSLLTQEQKDNTLSSGEIKLFKDIIRLKNTHQALYLVFRCPTLIKALKVQYPSALYFTTAEHCLFASDTKDALTMDINAPLKEDTFKIFDPRYNKTLNDLIKNIKYFISEELHRQFNENLAVSEDKHNKYVSIFKSTDFPNMQETNLVSSSPLIHTKTFANNPNPIKKEIPSSEHEALEMFRERYKNKLNNKNPIFRLFNKSRLDIVNKKLTLEAIFKHALSDNGDRTRLVLMELKWLDSHGNIDPEINKLIMREFESSNNNNNNF
ncbi:MAG TPA: hypothetical protein PK657_02025 [Legionella sp.]|nr:hypothetical protein [Legionella sp.]